MQRTSQLGGQRYRIWIARGGRPLLADHGQVPSGMVAVEPAEPGTMSPDEAATYVEAFNATALGHPGDLWAVAVAVEIRYEGEPRPGEPIEPAAIRWPTPGAQKKPATRLSGTDT
jgi:hypothetical protein